jgi:hypothetical protein
MNSQEDRPLEASMWQPILLLLGAAVYLYGNFFFSLRTPFLIGGDQVFFWMYAQRMFYGAHVYRDFFQFTPPGTDLLYLALFNLFGPRIWVLNAVAFALGIGLCALCFSIAEKIMRRSSAMLATAILVLIYTKSTSGIHHWLSTLAIMGAVRIYMGASSPTRIFITGALLGLASFFTQTHGLAALIAIGLFMVLMQRKGSTPSGKLLQSETLLVLGYSTALLLLSVHFIASVGLARLWYFQVTVVKQFVLPAQQGGLLGIGSFDVHHLLRSCSTFAVYLVLPISYLATIVRWWRSPDPFSSLGGSVALLCSVGVLLLMEVSVSANWLRIFAVAFAAIILLLWNVERSGMLKTPAVTVLWIVVAAIAIQQISSAHRHQNVILTLPAGNVALSEQSYEKMHWLQMHTTPGESFFQADWPAVYVPLNLRNPVFADMIFSGKETRPEDIASAMRQLEATHTRYILWAPVLDAIVPSQDNVTPLRNYLRNHYSPVHTFYNGETVWERDGLTVHP